jgi:O-antigen/teichoic acid export membrane protein
MIFLFVRFTLWVLGAMVALSALVLWAFAYVLIYAVGAGLALVYLAFGATRKPKRLKRPAITRRNHDRELDAFGHPIPQSRYSSRR